VNAPFKPMFEYKLKDKILLSPGSYFIGFQQGVASGLPVGFDKNTNSNSKVYFDSGLGWEPSVIYGSIMMNPVLGKKIIPVSISENSINAKEILAYPIPCDSELLISNQSYTKIEIINCIGEIVQSIVNPNEETIRLNTSNLSNGIYILSCTEHLKSTRSLKKIIVQH
jgi:hypothetical protein